jgi:hypothetical protein
MNTPVPPPTLASALREAATELQATPLPGDLKARVLAAAAQPAARHPNRWGATRRSRGGWWAALAPLAGRPWAWSGAAACAVVLAGSALLMLRPPAPALVDDGLRMGGFFPLVPPERWPREASPAWLVNTELPAERLAALGLPYDATRAGDSVRAELLLHPSGEVLAVRFLR